MIDANAFTKLVPGFDFLQGLMNTAGQAMPAMGQWVAPTLDPAELDKRIGELKTVQFWLEQNARMIATTVQALEVQRMTLATLQTMNLPVTDLQRAMTLPEKPARSPAKAPPAAPAKRAEPVPAEAAPAEAAAGAAAADAAAKPAGVDPMQWWGALTQQFGQLAAKAVQDGQAIAASTLAAAAAPPAGGTVSAAAKAAKAGSSKGHPPGTAGKASPKRAARKAAPRGAA